MIVKDLKLRNFRNYETAEVQFSPGLNVITGLNAQGKTNLLESLVYLSLTRSFRITEDSALIRSGCDFASLACTVQDKDRTIQLGSVIYSGGKTLSVNRVPVKRTSEFVGKLNTVLFSPDDLGIFLDAPRERRRLLDQEITKVSSGYLFALQNYRNLLKDRNALLKQNVRDDSYMEILEERMIREEETVILGRRAFIQAINENLPEYYRRLSGEDAEVRIAYQSCIPLDSEIKSSLKKMYDLSREKDLLFHSTGSGIHREDIAFTMNGTNVISCASQGQKRMILLSFKLAILNYIEAASSTKAVLLLDDVLSELDRNRQKTLMALISNSVQCIITGTEIPEFISRKQLKEFRVDQGKLIQGGSA
ncbi:MAG: DNA replication/repair protein RecF [Solobacterium sp.]|nr:DNA replication/repair protein RecF [Solobacterium sp.]